MTDTSAVMPPWLDTHCHLYMVEEAALAVEDARTSGIAEVVCIGIDAPTSAESITWAERFDGVHATVGLHPTSAAQLADEWDALRSLAASPGVIGIGECGFDFFHDSATRDEQEAAFRAQIGLAKEHDLALVIHTRDAWDATFSVLDDEGAPERTVFHCFSGGPDEARRCVDSYGAWLSMAGPISYKKNDHLREAARSVPLEHLVVETDSPFLSPQARRGKPNFPQYVALVGEALAVALGMTTSETAKATTDNARRLFRLDALV